MFETFSLSVLSLLHLVTLGVVLWIVRDYIKAYIISSCTHMTMTNVDQLIDGLLLEDAPAQQNDKQPTGEAKLPSATCERSSLSHPERFAAIVAGGQAKQYRLVLASGKALAAGQVDVMDEEGIERLYARYEARLGAAMTKRLGEATLKLYAKAAITFLPIPTENQPALVADLEGDPFVGHALSSAACELYHQYDMLLAPLTAVMTTIKHCQFEHEHSQVINDGREQPKDGGNEQFITSGTSDSRIS